ncbi:hypothetical protein PsorP6_005669 [Peronosclerospora sorghi]|uniref:Uncharacterized protein n=1 Tax=Peronosclerospora sorghi TaxID=230839 RepID=A0ACC0W7L1_9STRA|nr:hypothetical protein PsorP6_005669 [Peronosclerospora sorghi]
MRRARQRGERSVERKSVLIFGLGDDVTQKHVPRKAKKIGPVEKVNLNKEDVEEVSGAEDELVQRATRLGKLVAEEDKKLTRLEVEVTQIEQTKKALSYLMTHEETTKEKPRLSSKRF